MTIKRKSKETGEIEEREISLKSMFLGTPSFRTIILALILSQHPLGRQLLGTFGFEFPDQRKAAFTAEQATAAKQEIASIADTVKNIQTDVASLKANNAILNAKVDNMEQTFRGFQIDFNKWKPKETIQ